MEGSLEHRIKRSILKIQTCAVALASALVISCAPNSNTPVQNSPVHNISVQNVPTPSCCERQNCTSKGYKLCIEMNELPYRTPYSCYCSDTPFVFKYPSNEGSGCSGKKRHYCSHGGEHDHHRGGKY